MQVQNASVVIDRRGILVSQFGFGKAITDGAKYGIDLYRNVTLLNLNVKTIAPAHSTRPVPFDNLKKAIGLLPVASN